MKGRRKERQAFKQKKEQRDWKTNRKNIKRYTNVQTAINAVVFS